MKGQRKQSVSLTVASLVMLFSLVAGTWSIANGAEAALGVLPAANNAVIPTFSILSVSADNTVTIRTANFPANNTFNVLMNYMGTRGVGGYQVTTLNSGAGGTIDATFNIPTQLRGQYQIAIRLESPSSGYFAYNWFYNNTSGGIPPTGPTLTPGPTQPPFRVPTFTITAVTRDVSVSVRTANFPPNDTFVVRMHYMGTRGVGGTQVGTLTTGAGGQLDATYNIPDYLKGQYQVAIRFESPTSGYFSYNWFYNNTAGGIPPTGPTVTPGPSPTPGPTSTPFVTPTFRITGVVRDSSVTIQTGTFPANDTFVVRMHYMGTRGVGGTQVGTFNSGTGASQTATFNIPDYLKGQYQIAIRLESPTSGYFSYNWFYNNTVVP